MLSLHFLHPSATVKQLFVAEIMGTDLLKIVYRLCLGECLSTDNVLAVQATLGGAECPGRETRSGDGI